MKPAMAIYFPIKNNIMRQLERSVPHHDISRNIKHAIYTLEIDKVLKTK